MIIWTTCCFKLFSLIFLCTWLVHQNSSRSVNLSGFDDFGDGFLDQTGSNGPYAGTMYAKTWNRSLASHFVGRAGVLHVFFQTGVILGCAIWSQDWCILGGEYSHCS